MNPKKTFSYKTYEKNFVLLKKFALQKYLQNIKKNVQGEKLEPTNTTKPVGRHFRLTGHVAHRDFRFLPIEKIQSKDPFVRKVRESMWIKRCGTLKNSEVTVIEHGLNLAS